MTCNIPDCAVTATIVPRSCRDEPAHGRADGPGCSGTAATTCIFILTDAGVALVCAAWLLSAQTSLTGNCDKLEFHLLALRLLQQPEGTTVRTVSDSGGDYQCRLLAGIA
jgi:hypothetical protein